MTLRQQQKLEDKLSSRPLVGLVVDGITGYGKDIMRGVMRYANLQRRWLIHEELRYVFQGGLRDWPACDGAILAGVTSSIVDFVHERCRNVVFCSGGSNPHDLPVVCLDDQAAGVMAAEHLIDCGLVSFGFHGNTSLVPVAMRRCEGFREVLTRHGFSCEVSGVHDTSPHSLARLHWPGLIKWLRALPKPVGIMAYDDSAARDLAGACLEADIAVPEQVAIVGVNNDDLACDSSWPPLSSVDAGWGRVGFLAAGLLDRLLRGETLKPEERLVRLAPLGVVRRQSTDMLAVDEPDIAAALRFIREHACDPCSVEDVLRQVPVGRRWLERQFTQRLGHSPHDQIMHVRMETARRLLQQPELSVEETAFRCGFSAATNFGRAFLQAVGMTPAAYRRTRLHGKQ
jgi:LacI family transcriptional regulator